jgi:transposase
LRLQRDTCSSRWCQMYRRRNVIERCVNKLKQWRSHATRSEGEYILAR